MKRRAFLQNLAVLSALPAAPLWAEMGAPIAVSAARNSSSNRLFCGIDAAGRVVFQTEMPSRGHAAAIHPKSAEAVAPARRPGHQAMVVDLSSGAVKTVLDLGEEGHFYGHGSYDANGDWLYTTENDLETSQGRIGVWDVNSGYTRVASIETGGIGSHELIALPWGGYAVANGGILTDPSAGRAKLNLPSMKPSMCIFDEKMRMVGQYELPPKWHQLSIRHLCAHGGRIAVGMQWEGQPDLACPVVAIWRDEELRLLETTAPIAANYIASVAGNGAQFAFSAPKANALIISDLDGEILRVHEIEEVSGVAAFGDGFLATANRKLVFVNGDQIKFVSSDFEWDNHLKAT